ncbi:MAG: integrin alpha [Planctomycetes bacterium]|nr:integrin alpha [Planctomycetota bacterium]
MLRGDNGELLCTHREPPTWQEWCCSLAALDDVDGDGVADLAVARFNFERTAQREGRVSIVSLRDGCEVAAVEGGRELRGLGLWLGVGEFDREPGLDLVTTAWWNRERSVLWLSGRLLQPILERYSEGCGVTIGTSLATYGDLDGDGLDEVVIGARRTLDSDKGEFVAEARISRAAPGDPLRTLAVSGAYDEGPLVAVLRGVPESARFVAVATPREFWFAGVWRIFDADGHIVRTCSDKSREYYPIAMAAANVRRDPPSRLIVVGARLSDGASRHAMDVECWGGPAWQTRLWRYEFEPPMKGPR